MRDVAFVPEGHILEADDRIGTDSTGHAANTLREDRIAFMRHRGRTFLSGLEKFLCFANFGTLPVAHLQSDFLECRCDDRQRTEIFGITVTLNDLRLNICGLQTEFRTNTLFDLRR